MAGLCWMAVVLAFSTSIGNSLPVDLKWVENHADILGKCLMEGTQVSLAVNIPVDQSKLEEVVKETAYVMRGYAEHGVYNGTYWVAAKRQKNRAPSGKPYTDHAEALVLDNIKPLADRSKDHILLLYSYLSPCGQKCTSSDPKHKNTNIITKINNTFQNSKWADSAFVFTKVFDSFEGKEIPRNEIKETFKKLKKTPIGQNIFRCYFRGTGPSCIKCFDNGVLSGDCVKNKAQKCLSHNRGCARVTM